MADDSFAARAARRQELAFQLLLAREEAGLTQAQIAEAMDWSLSKIIRIEDSEVDISIADLKALLRCYAIDDPHVIVRLVTMARAARVYSAAAAGPGSALAINVWNKLSGDDFEHAIEAQLAPANLILPPAPGPGTKSAPDYHFHTNESFWTSVLNELARANSVVHLYDFLLFEWFPRSPGLFHTKRGIIAREDAAHHVLQPGAMRVIYDDYTLPDAKVYDLYGKVRMLEGGLGCIRLLPKETPFGTLWFMSASSTRSAHEGIPVAVRDSDYQNCISLINSYGAMPCSLTGTLKFLPKPLLSLYGDYTDVPGLYVLVDDLQESSAGLLEESPVVSVAATFQPEGAWQASAAYASFCPGWNTEMHTVVDWLRSYAARYDGTIVTDFDEQVRHFDGAVFSLRKVFNGRLEGAEIGPVVRTSWHCIDDATIEKLLVNQDLLSSYRIHIGEVNVAGDVFSNIGSGAVIVNKSSLVNALNIVGKMTDQETVDALRQVAALIEQSGSSDALENFNAFTSELQQAEPKKSLLRSLWSGVVAALPSVVTLSDAVAKIVVLFR